MTVLTIDQEGVKVFTLPEELSVIPVMPDGRNINDTFDRLKKRNEQANNYNLALAQAKSSAILVKDQDEAWRMIFPDLPHATKFKIVSDIEKYVSYWYRPGHAGSRRIKLGEIYPIPGLKVTYDFVVPCRAKGDCQSPRNNDDGTQTKCISTCKFEYRVAILSLEEEKKPETQIGPTLETIIDFAKWWYSGIDREKVVSAYNRYKQEKKVKVHDYNPESPWQKDTSDITKPFENTPVSDGETQEELITFFKELYKNQQPIPPDIQAALNKTFFDLL